MTWLTWIPRFVGFLVWFAGALVTSNVTVLRDILTPGQACTPGIVQLPTACVTEAEVTFLSVLITLTPGTLTLGSASEPATAGGGDAETRVAEPGHAEREDAGRRIIYVHGMYEADAEALRGDLREMERRMLNGVRRKGYTP